MTNGTRANAGTLRRKRSKVPMVAFAILWHDVSTAARTPQLAPSARPMPARRRLMPTSARKSVGFVGQALIMTPLSPYYPAELLDTKYELNVPFVFRPLLLLSHSEDHLFLAINGETIALAKRLRSVRRQLLG